MAKKKKTPKIPNEVYEAEMFRLQTELVKLQEWTRQTGARIVVIFEGRDAAGKGGTIKRITEYLSPRVARIAALPTPTEREKGQWYFQRYIAHLPGRGRDRAVRPLLVQPRRRGEGDGLLHPAGVQRFLRQTPIFEQMLIDDGILLRKYWFSVSDAEQLRRFRSRLNDPVRPWKLSPMDLESINRWEDYSRAKDEMMVHTDSRPARGTWSSPTSRSSAAQHDRPPAVDHPLHRGPAPEVELPKRLPASENYQRPPRELSTYVPDHAAPLMGDPEANR